MASKLGPTANILVVDDDPMILRYVRTLLAVGGHRVHTASSGSDALQRIRHGLDPHLILVDLLMPELDGLQTLEQVRQLKPNANVVILSCVSDTQKVVQAMRLGACDYLTKPIVQQDLDRVLGPCLDRLDDKECVAQLIEDLGDGTFFVAASPSMHKIRSQAELVAKVDIPVLILGESGTGKEVLARVVRRSSSRAKKPFLKVNCAAVPVDLLESELFGYEPGAFTGATRLKPGKFELCDEGTIFLDEIGEMPLALQAKLLEVLQDQQFSRLGSSSVTKVDVRVIAATNLDIPQALAKHKLREDLYYRLNGFALHLPPLRERKQDIPLLLRHLMTKLSERYARPLLPLPQAVISACLNHPWPGNVRELENFVKRSLILGDMELVASELRTLVDRASAQSSTERASNVLSEEPLKQEPSGLKALARSAAKKVELEAILSALEETNWNRKEAAKVLKISYKALIYKIQQYNMQRSYRRAS